MKFYRQIHREEKQFAIQYATEDREKIRDILKHVVNPLDKEQLSHHQELVNIYTGQFADKRCNLEEAVKIGVEQYKKFISSLPDGFYSTINHIVKPMIPKIKKNKKAEEIIIGRSHLFQSNDAYAK